MTIPTEEILIEKHSFIKDLIFRVKASLLIVNRLRRNVSSPVPHFKPNNKLIDSSIIAFSESELWNPYDNTQNWILTAGKIENLRIAARKINRLEVKANEVFSFWKHIGNPNYGKGYVVGREIREGCIVPTIAGGLCQLSNALYDAALKANFEIVERHKHTKVIKGSLAEEDRDATVKWNYIDLRFKSKYDFRIEVEFTSDKFIVVFKSSEKDTFNQNQQFKNQQSSKINDCYSCGNSSCFKHPKKLSEKQATSNTTFILDKKWPEFDKYIKDLADSKDTLIIPIKKNRYDWSIGNKTKIKSTTKEGISRTLKFRIGAKKGANLFELGLALDHKIAEKITKIIPIESTHLVISQNLLPFLYKSGALGGRTFDVLMTRLPMEKLHEKLDNAFKVYNTSETLNDFRAPHELISHENKALNQARKIITPHSEIAEIFKNKIEKLEWAVPENKTFKMGGTKILFPASAVARKGAFEIKKLAQELSLTISVSGNAIEKANFWEGVTTEKFNGDYNDIKLVIYPVYVEHQPRQILKAISKGIPVITTSACGLESSSLLTLINVGDYEQLKKEVEKFLSSK